MNSAAFTDEPEEGPHERLRRTHRAVQSARLGDELPVAARTITVADLAGTDRSWLQGEFQRLVALGVPAQVSASYLVGWYAANLAEFVGLCLASERAAVSFHPPSVRWHVHTDGWIVGVEGDFVVTVASDHPWASRADVAVVNDQQDVVNRAITDLVDTVRPIIDACRALTRIGAVGLWNEIGDAVGMALAHQTVVEADDDNVALLAAAAASLEAPWRTRPRLWFVDEEHIGRLHVAQKGGCCLAYKEPIVDESVEPVEPASDEVADALDDYHRACVQRFPKDPADKLYCSTCSFRDAEDCAARQVLWREFHPTVPPTGAD